MILYGEEGWEKEALDPLSPTPPLHGAKTNWELNNECYDN